MEYEFHGFNPALKAPVCLGAKAVCLAPADHSAMVNVSKMRPQ